MAENIKKVVRNGQVFNVPGSASDDQIDTYFRNKFGDSSRTWSHTAAMPGAPEAGAAPAGRSMRAAPTPGAMTAGMGGAPDLSFASMRKGGRPLPTEEDLRLAEVHRDIFRRQREQSAEMAEEFGTEDYKIGNFFANIGRGRQKLDYNPDAAAFSRAEAERFSDENWQRQYGGRTLSDADRAKMRSEIEDYYRQRQGLRPEQEALYGAGTGVGRGLINYGANVLENLSLGALDLGNFQSKISEEMALGSSAEAQAAKAAGVDISQFAPSGVARNLSQIAEGAGAGIGMTMTGKLATGAAGKLATALRASKAAPAAATAATNLAQAQSIAQRGLAVGKKILQGAAVTGIGAGLGAEPAEGQGRLEAVGEAGLSGAWMGGLGGAIAGFLNKIPANKLPGLVGKAWSKDIIRFPITNAAGNLVTERYFRLDGSTPTSEELGQAAALGLIFGMNDWLESRAAKSKIPELKKAAADVEVKIDADRETRAAQLPEVAARVYGMNPDEVKAKIDAKRGDDGKLPINFTGDNTGDLASVLDIDARVLNEARARTAKAQTDAVKAEADKAEAERKKAEVESARVKALVDTGEFTEDEARAAIVEQDMKSAEAERDSAAADALGVTIAQYRKLRDKRMKERAAAKTEAPETGPSPEELEASRLERSLRLQEETGMSPEEADRFIRIVDGLPEPVEDMGMLAEAEGATLEDLRSLAEAGLPKAPASKLTVKEALASARRRLKMLDARADQANRAYESDPSDANLDRWVASQDAHDQYLAKIADVETKGANPDTLIPGYTPPAAAPKPPAPPSPPPAPPEAGEGGAPAKPSPKPKVPPAAPKQAPPAAPKQAPAPAPAAAPAEPAPAPKKAGLGGRKKAATTADEIEQARLREAEAEAEREAMRDVPVLEEEPEAVVEGAAAPKPKAEPKAKTAAAPQQILKYREALDLAKDELSTLNDARNRAKQAYLEDKTPENKARLDAARAAVESYERKIDDVKAKRLPPDALMTDEMARQAGIDPAKIVRTFPKVQPKGPPPVPAAEPAAAPKAVGLGGRRRAAAPAEPGAPRRPDAKQTAKMRATPTLSGRLDVSERSNSPASHEIAQALLSENALGIESADRPARVMNNQYISRMMSGEFAPPIGGGEPNPEAKIAENSIARLRIPGLSQSDARRIAIGGGTPEEYDLVSRINKTEIAGALGIIRKVARTVAPRVGIAVTRSIDGNIDRAIESGLVRLGEDKRQTILQSIFARSQELGVGSTRQALPDSLKRLSINNILAGKNPENRLPLIVANEAEIASLYDETRQAMVGKGASQERAHEIASRVVNERIAQYVLKSIESGTFIGTNRQRANTLAYAKSSKAAADRQRLANDIENPVVVEPVPQTVEEALSSPAFQPTPGGLTGLMKTAKPEPSAAPPRQELSSGTVKEAKVSRTAGLIPGSAVPALGVGSPKRVEPVGTPSAIVDAVIRGEPAMSPSTTAAILEQAAVSMSEAGGLGTKNKSVQILKGLAEAFREGTVAKFVEAGRKRDGRRFDQAMRAGLNRADIEAEALRGEPRSEGTRGFRTPGNVRRRIEIEGEVGMREATPNAGEEFYNTPAAEILSSAGTAKEILTDAAIGRLISDIPGSPGFAEKYGDLWGKAVERDALSRGYDEEEAKVIRDHERLLAIDANLVSDDKMTVTQQRNIARRKGRMKQMLTNLERNLPDNWAEDSQQLYGDSRAYTPEPAAEGEGARLSKFVSDLKSPRFGGVEQSTTPGVRVPANSQLALELSAPNEIAPARRRELLALFERRRAQAEQMFEDGELTRNGFKRLIEIVDHYTAVLSGMPAPRPKGAGAFYTQEGAPVEGAPYNEGIGRMVERGREVAGGQEFMFFDQRATDAARIIGEGPGVEIDLRASQPQTKIGVRRTGIGGRPSRDLSQMGAAYNPAALLFEAAVKGGKVLVEAVKRVFGAATDVGRQFMARVRAAKGDPAKIREAVDEAVKGVTPQPVADVTAEAVGETMSMAGRVKSVGGAVAARVGEMFKQTADETRRFEGELSVEERELMEASGGLFAAGRSFGPLNSPERQAAASLAEIIPVPGTNYGESKFQQAIEGRYEGTLTPQERRIVDAAIRLGARTLELAKGVGMLRLNRTTGKLEGYENVPAGREGMVFRNMPTQEMTEIISVGKAHTMWPELVDAIQQKNPDKSTGEIEEALLERHAAFRQMGVSSNEKTSALEFFREFQMPAGLVRENGKVVPLFETNPSKWGKAMVRSSATRLGFVSVFGQDFAYNPDTMEIEPDLPSPIDIQKEEYSMSVDRRKRGLAEGYFDQARRVAEGRLLEPPSERETGVPQRAARLLIDFINSPIKTMKLSASPLYNALEPFGMAAEQAGYGNVFEAYSDAILSGLYNLTNGKFGSESAAKIFRNLERMGAMGVERVSSQRFVTGVAARAMELSVAKMKARKAGGPGADDDSARLVQMGYDQATANRLARGGGTDAEYDRLIRGAGPSATGGRMGAVEKSRLENTRWFKTWFPIATYATRQLQQFVRTAKMAYDTPKMSRLQAEAATKQILKMAGGRAASGTAQNLMFAFFIGGTAGLRAAWSALKDDPLDKIIEGATSSVFSGPYAGVAQNMMRGDDSIFKTIFPLAVVMEAGDLLTNGGRYENLEPGDKLVEATQWLIPAVKVVSGLGSTAMSILGDDDISREVKQVKSAYYRWAREEKIRRPFGGILNPTEADEAFARAMKRARRAIESRQPEKAGQYLREAMGVEGKDARSVATSLDRVRVLKSLDEAQLDSLRRKIGEKNFQILVAEDDLIESIVKSFAGDRKGKAKVTMFPEGRVQSSFGLGRAR